MSERRNRYLKRFVLLLIAAFPRILGAFFLPNAFGDAYVYIQEIGTLSTKISNGSFRLTHLFGFWLPLYQLIAASLNVVIKNGFYSGKIVAALFGAGTCLFVYLVTQRVTNNETATLSMFLLIAFNPLHTFYSASAMTDVPHTFFVIASLYFVLTGNWIIAAVFAALAGFTRVESWMLIALLPFIQFVRERRISLAAVMIMLIPPVLWFYISWKATGNWLACFVQRQQYHDWLLQMNPSIAQFSVVNVLKDGATLLVSTDVAVLIASLVAGWFAIRKIGSLGRSSHQREASTILVPALFFFAFLALLVLAYLTHQQPIIFPRYGLILFTLGLPILAGTFLEIRKRYPQLARRALLAIIVICAADAAIQFAAAVGTVNQYRAQRAVADYLRDHFDSRPNGKIFCDDGTVRVLSGIPEARFLTSSQVPDQAVFTAALHASEVQYVVLANSQGANPAATLQVGETPNLGDFKAVYHKRTAFLPADIWVLKAAVSGEK